MTLGLSKGVDGRAFATCMTSSPNYSKLTRCVTSLQFGFADLRSCAIKRFSKPAEKNV